ncbi:FecR domain-containing protein [Pseudomonadota bacterium AL_CKDN230030165-1A_HGKHYDSX7]
MRASAAAENRVLEAAAHWYAVLSSDAPSERERADWRAWLDDDPAHRTAWQRVEAISAGFDSLAAQPLSREASLAGLEAAARGRRERRRLLSLALFAGAGGALLWGAAGTPVGRRTLAAWRSDLSTPVGGTQDVALADGTRVRLNTDTALRVDYSGTLRRLVLLRGEIMIATAHDASRAFVVDTAEGRLRALGTRFNVRSLDGETTLAVFEGAVQAHFAGGAPAGYRVDAGMRVRGGGQGTAVPVAATAQDQNWVHGLLQVEDAPLAQVLAELGRYRRGYLGCEDALASIPVTGTFPLRDPDRALRMLAEGLSLRISQPLPWWTRLHRS